MALLLFFITSSALSRWGKRQKAGLGYEKGGKRDAGQVLANGGAAALCAVLLAAVPSPFRHFVLAAMLGALATANADTWATEIGSLLGGRPRRITDFAETRPGESGAVSLAGTLAALAGASLLGLMAQAWHLGVQAVIAVTIAGLAGALADSFLGATVQAQYRDPATGRLTERHTASDGTPHSLARGHTFITNDVVNLLATLVGALIAAIMVGGA